MVHTLDKQLVHEIDAIIVMTNDDDRAEEWGDLLERLGFDDELDDCDKHR